MPIPGRPNHSSSRKHQRHAIYATETTGLLLIAFSLYNLLRPKMPDLKSVGKAGDAGIGFLNGVLGGSTGLGGILEVRYRRSLELEL